MGNNMEMHKTYTTPIPDKCDYCNSKPTLMVIVRVVYLLKATRFDWGFVCAKHKDKLALDVIEDNVNDILMKRNNNRYKYALQRPKRVRKIPQG
jgi:hypothetical protein